MVTQIIDFLKKYTNGKQNTEKVEISVLQLNRVIKALEQESCEDAVSRKAVNELFDSEIKMYEERIETRKGSNYHDETERIKEFRSRVANAEYWQDKIRALPPVKPTQRWIPVNEKLPSIKNQTNKYLVTLKDKTVCDAMFTEHNGKHWWTYNDVVAWMPLPKPYNKRLGLSLVKSWLRLG